MSSQHDSPDDAVSSSRRIIGKEMAEAVVRAQKTINRYANARKTLAQKSPARDDDQSFDAAPDLQERLKDVDVATLNAFTLMQHYIREDTDGYWNTKIVGYDDGVPVVFGAPEPEEISNGEITRRDTVDGDVKYLSEYRNSVTQTRMTEHVRFEGEREKVYVQPDLLPIDAYKTTVRLLFDTLKETEFAPQAAMPDITADEVL